MAIVNCDVLIQGVRRDSVFEWLSDPLNHARFLEGCFDQITSSGAGEFDLQFHAPPKKRVLGYHFDRPDDSHGGRRILIRTSGKRTTGTLNYSLRTMKPSRNTLITLTMDYDPGSVLGGVLNRSGISPALESHFKKVLENLQNILCADLAQ